MGCVDCACARPWQTRTAPGRSPSSRSWDDEPDLPARRYRPRQDALAGETPRTVRGRVHADARVAEILNRRLPVNPAVDVCFGEVFAERRLFVIFEQDVRVVAMR